MLAAAMLLALTGCPLGGAAEKTFTRDGLTITLTDEFTEKDDLDGQTVYFEALRYIATALKEEFSMFEEFGIDAGNMSIDEYAELVVEVNGFNTSVVKKDGLTTFKYEASVGGQDFTYFATVHKSADAFWLVQFFCETKNYASFESKFIEWAKSVKV
jgi:hypothetical protein